MVSVLDVLEVKSDGLFETERNSANGLASCTSFFSRTITVTWRHVQGNYGHGSVWDGRWRLSAILSLLFHLSHHDYHSSPTRA